MSAPAKPSNRPLSPHLQVYKWGPHMLVSIVHRATGDGMAVVGSLLLVWWLMAAASGPMAYQKFLNVATAWYGQLFLIALSWGFLQHACSGLRHLYLDTGRGYDLKANRLSSMATFLASGLLTAALWAFIFLTRR
jgi:succinate dehydrogenase / fumarate reductase, cytochrome b subunit